MGKIVAIGGGELHETHLINKFIVSFSDAPHPNLLFIPTASYDAPGYIQNIQRVYGDLGCNVSSLLLHKQDTIQHNEIRNKILTSDIIYVGGGNTSMMMDVLRKYHIDKYLQEAFTKNIVLSGISAGSNCWFEMAYGDSNPDTNSGWWDTHPVKGIGLLSAIHCPHYNNKGSAGFDELMKTSDIPGIAIDDYCALAMQDNVYRVICCNEQSHAYFFENKNGILEKTKLDKDDAFYSMNDSLSAIKNYL